MGLWFGRPISERIRKELGQRGKMGISRGIRAPTCISLIGEKVAESVVGFAFY